MPPPPNTRTSSHTALQKAHAYRELAAKLAPGCERDELLQKAREADAANRNTGTGDSKEPDELFRRAEAAIAESRRLAAQVEKWQDDILQRVRRLRFRAAFLPHSQKTLSSLDFLERHRVFESFPSEHGED